MQGEELKLQADETKLLAKERTATAEQARILAREVEIYADKEKEWARQGSRKTQENKALKSRITELEQIIETQKSSQQAAEEELRRHFTKEVCIARCFPLL